MKLKCFLFFLIFSYSIAGAQTSSSVGEDTDCSVVSERIKDLYRKMFHSPSATTYRKLMAEFTKKVGNKVRFDNLEYVNCEDKILLWIQKNIDKTKWQTYAEAEKEWQNSQDVYTLIAKENPELYDYVKEMYKHCPAEVNKTFEDLINEYGIDFVM